MHLKLRHKTPRPTPSRAVDAPSSHCISFIYKPLNNFETPRDATPNLAADVHLYSSDYCGETLAVLKKVLIVDDSPAQVKLMLGLLEREGYSPVGLNDPKLVEQTIQTVRPNVILLDVVMPDRNGFQVCRDLKANSEFSDIPVIMVTSKDSASDKFWGEQQGADGYVTKPFTREDLLRAVRRFA